MLANNFEVNKLYESKTHGTVQFLGWDTYMGQQTMKFRSITYKKTTYWLPSDEALLQHFDLANIARNLTTHGQEPAGGASGSANESPAGNKDNC